MLLGILQGVTEWLPISSSGHLAIFQFYFGEEPSILFGIILHLGSLCVILYITRDEIRQLIMAFPNFLNKFQSGDLKGNERMVAMIIVASLPTAAIGLIFVYSEIVDVFYSEMHLIGGCLIFTGLLVWFSKGYDDGKQIDNFPIKNVLVIGLFQGLGVLPGVSRSGSTIAISKILGMDSVKAARFSFLLFIPTIIGAILLDIRDIKPTLSEIGPLSLILGFLASVVTSYLAVNVLLKLIRQHKFHYFTPYCVALGLILIFDSLN